MEDDYFIFLIFAIGGFAVFDRFLNKYGYERLISDIKSILITFSILVILVIILIIAIKLVIKFRREPVKIVKEIVRVPDEVIISRTIKRLPPKKEVKEEIISDIIIKVNTDKRLFWSKDLNKDEISYLKNKGYIERIFKNYFTNKKEKFVFRPNSNESDIHSYVVFLIEYYFKNKYKIENVRIFETVNPDLVFEINEKKYAIEVETGKIYQHNRKQLENKIRLLNKNYDKWIFVVTNKNLVSKYRKYGRTIDLRYLKKQLESFLKTPVNSPY